MLYPFYIFLGVLPSLIWLSYFLRKDVHPESNRMVLKIFFFGLLSAVPAAFIEMGVSELILRLGQKQGLFISLVYWFLGIAFVEETLKYLVVKSEVLKDPEFDEPIDAMLYMIIASLGFAALENILILWPAKDTFLLASQLNILLESLILGSLRFVGATFLHALCSATVGFFLGLAFFKKEKRAKLTALGLAIAVSLHGLYNFSIMEMSNNFKVFIPTFILISSALFVLLGFRGLKNLKRG